MSTDLHPAGPLAHANWRFDHSHVPATPEALLAEVITDEAQLGFPLFGPEPAALLGLSGLRELDISLHDIRTGKPAIVRLGDGSRELSWGEIVLLLHRAYLDKFASFDPDHCYFEGLRPLPATGSVPLFDVYMGS
ncbi:MAG: hypothetical protein ACXWVD_00070 [Telluria sp.]